jgi:hypothetical protein
MRIQEKPSLFFSFYGGGGGECIAEPLCGTQREHVPLLHINQNSFHRLLPTQSQMLTVWVFTEWLACACPFTFRKDIILVYFMWFRRLFGTVFMWFRRLFGTVFVWFRRLFGTVFMWFRRFFGTVFVWFRRLFGTVFMWFRRLFGTDIYVVLGLLGTVLTTEM